MDLDPYRLPRAALPQRYDLMLAPDLGAATFSGHVRVTLDVAEETSLVVLNANELEIHEVLVNGAAVEFSLAPETERLLVTTSEPLDVGPAELQVTFSGVLNDKLRGFYRSTYRDATGEERVIATTQMQPTDCRRAFPCWDEPDCKAVFGITLEVDNGLTAVSNGPEISREQLPDGRERIRFADTMPMSTYLVAVVVGPLECTPVLDVEGVPMRIVHVPGNAHLTDFGTDVAAFSLRWFQEYYGIPYPSDKVDLIALPDFAAGAMENLGCITFRESLLLVDPSTSTQQERQLVADVVAHELAHMWFGDLVTMRWWNGIWLNEAFATFMEIAACDAYRPDWQRWTTFGQERTVAFETDALASTRSVEYEVRSPADSEGMFDVLTYQKGGALLRMLEQYLGPDQFRRGVSHYLAAHSYSNTETSDLWDAIETVTGEPVRQLMDSWIWQPGFPLVRASTEGGELVLRQERFRYLVDPDGGETRWIVPVHVRVGSAPPVKILLDGPEARLALPSDPAPVLVNAEGVGFYRVAYDDELRSRLDATALAGMDSLERYCLVDDAWAAVVGDRMEAGPFMRLAAGFSQESDLAVWQALANGLRGAGRLVEGDDHRRLQAAVRSLVTPLVDRLGWEVPDDEPDLTGKLRGLAIPLLAILGNDPDSQARCRELLQRSRHDPATVPAELVAAATTVVAATGDASDFEQMLRGFQASNTPQEQLRHLYALAEFPDAALIERACRLALSNDVKSQNAPFLLNRCIANRWHGNLAWDIVRAHWAEANERFPVNTIIRMVDTVKLLNTPMDGTTARAFFTDHPIPHAAATLEQVLERQQVNIALRQREAQRFGTWLRNM